MNFKSKIRRSSSTLCSRSYMGHLPGTGVTPPSPPKIVRHDEIITRALDPATSSLRRDRSILLQHSVSAVVPVELDPYATVLLVHTLFFRPYLLFARLLPPLCIQVNLEISVEGPTNTLSIRIQTLESGSPPVFCLMTTCVTYFNSQVQRTALPCYITIRASGCTSDV